MPSPIQINSRAIVPHRIFCVGKNYSEHIRELKSEASESPVIFMKPVSSLLPVEKPIRIPDHGSVLHHEVEVVVLIGRDGKDIPENEAGAFITGITLGIDLTLRDLQTKLKKGGLPWELSKAFDGSAPLGKFLPYDDSINLADISFKCVVDRKICQKGNTADMIFPIPFLISYLSGIWELRPGDLIFTGTPAGVGPLHLGNKITIESDLTGTFTWEVKA
ncbi:MAG: fumarylacetoacetate hydrolase family protein [Nitrospinota bacterium]|nr:fumarylacetoacetate hydrolase family protein [Nitrospinota bacterium]